jgi:hypothetical protein
MKSYTDIQAFVQSKCDEWEEYRDNNYKDKWEEYYRLWRGIWQDTDKTRNSERSKLISPALQQAVESTTAEIEEAVFGKGQWFDLGDDIADQDKNDAQLVRGLLREDLDLARSKEALQEIIFNGTLYGTGIGELTMEPYSENILVEVPQPNTLGVTSREVVSKETVIVKIRSVSPERFLVDPVATNIEEAFGCAVVDYVSIHKITEGIQKGYYNKVDVGDLTEKEDVFGKGEQSYRNEGKVKLTTYYGLVPYGLLKEEETQYEELFENEEVEEASDKYVEAIVIIANDSEVLKAVENPYFGKDRPLVAYQHEKVPNRFWGRGVAEKGYNPQKALDAELRARIDSLALSTHPMMGVDATKLPRGMKFEVAPGKSILTNGNPAEVLMPLNFNTISQTSFAQSGDLERQVQVGTGAMDTAAPVSMVNRNSTASGMSMMSSAAIKKAKRTLMNFQEKVVIPVVNKALWRYIQFRPDRYPVKDYKFVPVATMGIMAREYEQQLLVQLLSVTPPQSPAYPLIMEAIITNSSISNREQILAKLIESQKPDPMAQQIQMAQVQADIEKKKAEAAYLTGQLEGIKIKAEMDAVELSMKQLDKVTEKQDNVNPELELKAKEIIIKAKEAEEKLAIDRAKAEQSFAIEQAKLKLQEAELIFEQQRVVEEKQSEIAEINEARQTMEQVRSYLSAKKRPVRDSAGTLIGVEIEGFGTRKVNLDESGMIKEIE